MGAGFRLYQQSTLEMKVKSVFRERVERRVARALLKGGDISQEYSEE